MSNKEYFTSDMVPQMDFFAGRGKRVFFFMRHRIDNKSYSKNIVFHLKKKKRADTQRMGDIQEPGISTRP